MKWLGPVFVAVILPLLLGVHRWCLWLARRLIRRAVRRLPEDARVRWEEEWLGDLAAFEGRRLSILVRVSGSTSAPRAGDGCSRAYLRSPRCS